MYTVYMWADEQNQDSSNKSPEKKRGGGEEEEALLNKTFDTLNHVYSA